MTDERDENVPDAAFRDAFERTLRHACTPS